MNFKDIFKDLPKGFKLASKDDFPLVNLTIALAFADAEYPTPSTKVSYNARLKANYKIIEAMILNASQYGGVFTNEDYSAALVVTPNSHKADIPYEEVKEILRKEASEEDAINIESEFEKFETIENKLNLPKDIVYLECFAVQTHKQGRHLGSTLMRALISQCEKYKKDLVLFTNVLRNKQIYEHLGFKCIYEEYDKDLNLETYFMYYSF